MEVIIQKELKQDLNKWEIQHRAINQVITIRGGIPRLAELLGLKREGQWRISKWRNQCVKIPLEYAIVMEHFTQVSARRLCPYGSHAARTLGTLTGTKLVFRLDSYAANQVSELFGEQEVLESNESISFGANPIRDGVSLSAQRRVRPLISPAEIMKLDNLEAYLKFPRNLPAAKVKFKLYADVSSGVAFESNIVENVASEPVAENGI